MGYSTDFEGRFDVSPTLSSEMSEYLHRLASTRRMKRDPEKIMEIYPDWQDWCFNDELGVDGEFFAYDDGNFGQTNDESVIEYNYPPDIQPGLWLQWIPTDDNAGLEWDGGEKFYEYIDWLEYLIQNILAPSGYVVNGAVAWFGEDPDDQGTIEVNNNVVSVSYRD